MKLIPAIDLRNGRCVRLLRGEKGTETVYADDPVAMARHWEREGAEMLHVVDLDAAFGEASQRERVAEIVRGVDIPVQVGGGMRGTGDFRALCALGAFRVVFGTVAVQSPEVVERALQAAPEKVAVGVDVKEGAVAVRGWRERSGESPLDFGRRWVAKGVSSFVYTDVSRDGAMEGLNVEATEEFARGTGARVVASGGIGSLDDLRRLARAAAASIEGVIVGRALYEGAFTPAEARSVLE